MSTESIKMPDGSFKEIGRTGMLFGGDGGSYVLDAIKTGASWIDDCPIYKQTVTINLGAIDSGEEIGISPTPFINVLDAVKFEMVCGAEAITSFSMRLDTEYLFLKNISAFATPSYSKAKITVLYTKTVDYIDRVTYAGNSYPVYYYGKDGSQNKCMLFIPIEYAKVFVASYTTGVWGGSVVKHVIVENGPYAGETDTWYAYINDAWAFPRINLYIQKPYIDP
jgi:hypothetical protein